MSHYDKNREFDDKWQVRLDNVMKSDKEIVQSLENKKNAARYKFCRDNMFFMAGMFNINTERGAAIHKISNCADAESLDITIDEAIEVFKGKR